MKIKRSLLFGDRSGIERHREAAAPSGRAGPALHRLQSYVRGLRPLPSVESVITSSKRALTPALPIFAAIIKNVFFVCRNVESRVLQAFSDRRLRQKLLIPGIAVAILLLIVSPGIFLFSPGKSDTKEEHVPDVFTTSRPSAAATLRRASMLANMHSFDTLKLPDGLEDELLPAVPRPSSKDTGFEVLTWHSDPVAAPSPVYEVVVAPEIQPPEMDHQDSEHSGQTSEVAHHQDSEHSGQTPEVAAPAPHQDPSPAHPVTTQDADASDTPRFSFDADAARFLIVENMEGGLDMAMLGLEELAALAAASGRILVEPHVLWFPDDRLSALGSPLLGGQDEGPVSTFLQWEVAYAGQRGTTVHMDDFRAAMSYRLRRKGGGLKRLHLVYACPWPHHCKELNIDGDECLPACRLGQHYVQASDGHCPDTWKANLRELSANPPSDKTVTMCASLAIPPEPSVDEMARTLGLYSSWDVVTIRNFAGGTTMSRALPPGTDAGLPPGVGGAALRGVALASSLAALPQDSKLVSERWGYRRRLEQLAMRVVYHSTGAEAEGSGHVPEYAAVHIPHAWMRSSASPSPGAGASGDKGGGDKLQALCAELFAQAVAEELSKTHVSLLFLTSPMDGGDAYVAQLRAKLGDRVTLFSIDTSAFSEHLSPVEHSLLGRIICQHAATLFYVSSGIMRPMGPPGSDKGGQGASQGVPVTNGAPVIPPWCVQGSPLYTRWVLRTRKAAPAVNLGPRINQQIGAFAWTLASGRRRVPLPKKVATTPAAATGRSPLPSGGRGGAPARGATASSGSSSSNGIGSSSSGNVNVRKPPVVTRASSKNPVVASKTPVVAKPPPASSKLPAAATGASSKGRSSGVAASPRGRATPAPAAAAVAAGSDKRKSSGDKGKASNAPTQLFGFNPFAVKKRAGTGH